MSVLPMGLLLQVIVTSFYQSMYRAGELARQQQGRDFVRRNHHASHLHRKWKPLFELSHRPTMQRLLHKSCDHWRPQSDIV